MVRHPPTCIFARMIDLQGITKSYDTGGHALQVLKGIDMNVKISVTKLYFFDVIIAKGVTTNIGFAVL